MVSFIHQRVLLFPGVLVIDADEVRLQQIGRLLTLAGYRPFLATRPYDAFERALHEPDLPQAIFLGQPALVSHHLVQRLLQHIAQRSGQIVPLLLLPRQIPNPIPLHANYSSPAFHLLSRASLDLLEPLWSCLSPAPPPFARSQQSLVLTLLPGSGWVSHVSQYLHSRNSHFRRILTAAYDLIGEAQWKSLITDVGLACYCQIDDWPADNEQLGIPAEYLSYLHQAVAFSQPDDPVSRLRQWSERATSISTQKRTPSGITQQFLKLLPEERVMGTILNAFTEEMNTIRGEILHLWRRQPDGSYWLVHYSNLYAYGRISASQPTCHVWEASLERTFRLAGLHANWQVRELECSCQTLTGHCLFAIQPR